MGQLFSHDTAEHFDLAPDDPAPVSKQPNCDSLSTADLLIIARRWTNVAARAGAAAVWGPRPRRNGGSQRRVGGQAGTTAMAVDELDN